MSKEYLIGIDIGSSNTKIMICDKKCRIISNEMEENEIIIPKPGWVEYDPNEWWRKVKLLLRKSLSKSHIESSEIAGIGISSLGGTVVTVNENGETVYNAIPWSDQRAEEELELLERKKDIIFKITGNIPNILNSTSKILWFKNKKPEIYKNIYKFFEPTGFLGLKLTGNFTMDWTFASGFDLGFDYKKLKFSDELVEKIGLDIDKFPDLHANTRSIGGINRDAALKTGLAEGTPVFIGGHDVVAAAVGAGAIYPGQGYFSVGSAANLLLMTDKDITSPYMLSILHIVNPKIRILDGVQSSVGFSLKWFRDNLGSIEKEISEKIGNLSAFEIFDIQAEKASPGSGGLIYLPFFFGKFHPDFMKNTSSCFIGISPKTKREQIIRSIMEGTIYNMYENLESAFSLGIKVDEIITNGGPARSRIWCQIMADIANKKIITLNSPEGSPFGNIILAGVGSGLFGSFDEAIENFVIRGTVFNPDEKNHKLYMRLFGIYKEISASLKDNFTKLKELKTSFNLV
ncbi:MAG TPA: hypothetical protein GXZ93_02615 [Actinobacteria bacterium]|nr:hypothetical protein [Actinomycetota bacterium]